ncbi:GNAT family N-acetyltransferase [Rhodovastum atsumiense]|uniref:GNAT family N-acetyltransferase n=1 Tax=Rhodovastum atsumiense TaxID=504468 RepID=A0A5M6IKE4_9PROT|nr:GNAT family N-acetyltransferase [Rhodovastum atsumiense]KAA5608349.1 GNAT family N-acetyltransferase [Rhodovastum atsumiense]CAH2602337.1 GNAT family N-acetyltransferase [Rhodovastum atsumiense]
MVSVKPDLILTSTPDEVARSCILDPLLAFNVGRAGEHGRTPLAVLIKEPTEGTIVGGLWGRTSWKWLTIELLFVPEVYRGSGLGSEVMRLAENEGARRGCIGAWVDTFSYQAPGFYEKSGFIRFGEIEDYPPGHSRIFFQKRFR